MRTLLVLALTACSSKPPCDTVKVHVGSKVIEIPARAEYCLYMPDSAKCCVLEGTDCKDADTASGIFEIERAPGCDDPRSKR